MGDGGRADHDLALRGAREHDPHRVGVGLLDLTEQLGALHRRHAHVGHDDVVWLAPELDERPGLPARTAATSSSGIDPASAAASISS